MRVLITVYFLAVGSSADATYATAVLHFDDEKVLKDDFRMVMLNDLHRCGSVELVRDEKHRAWATGPLCMRFVFLIDVMGITPALEIKLGKIVNSSTAIVRAETSFTDAIQNDFHYV